MIIDLEIIQVVYIWHYYLYPFKFELIVLQCTVFKIVNEV